MTEYTTNVAVDQLKDIVKLVLYATEGSNLQQVLQRIAAAARDLIKAKYAALGVPDGRGGLDYFEVAGLSEEEIAQIPHPPVGHGLIGEIMHHREAIRVPRMQDDERSSGFPENHPHMTSMLGVPVQSGTQLFGMLYLCDREDGHSFSLSDQWLAETLAGYAALAIAGSHLREQESRLTLLEERQRIGMELHDGVIQSLYAVGMYLDLARNSNDLKPENVTTAIDSLNDVIEEIRNYIMDLRTSTYTKKTIREALHDILARLYVPTELDIQVNAPDQFPPFDASDFESICFIAREALSNAIRHADASAINVTCQMDHGSITLTVSDDGKGFDPNSTASQNGLGLRHIRQRAVKHDGEAKIESAPGKGATVVIEIPLS